MVAVGGGGGGTEWYHCATLCQNGRVVKRVGRKEGVIKKSPASGGAAGKG